MTLPIYAQRAYLQIMSDATLALHAVLEAAHRLEGNPTLLGVCIADAVATATPLDRNRLDVAAFTERLTTLIRRTSELTEETPDHESDTEVGSGP
jgi:hypothetical protein